MQRPKIQAQVIKSVTKAQLVELAMTGYVGSAPELQRRQYQRRGNLELALHIQRRAYLAQRGL